MIGNVNPKNVLCLCVDCTLDMPVLWIIWALWLIRLRRLRFITGERWTLTLSTTELSSTWAIFWSKHIILVSAAFGFRHCLCVHEEEDDGDIVFQVSGEGGRGGEDVEGIDSVRSSFRWCVLQPRLSICWPGLALSIQLVTHTKWSFQFLLDIFSNSFKRIFCVCVCVWVGTFKRSKWNLHQGYWELSRQFWPP